MNNAATGLVMLWWALIGVCIALGLGVAVLGVLGVLGVAVWVSNIKESWEDE